MERRGRKSKHNHTYRAERGIRQIRPLLIVGVEGETEQIHVSELAKRYGFNLVVVGPDNRPDYLLTDIKEATNEYSKRQPRRAIIPLLIYDIETMDDHAIKACAQFVGHAKAVGVSVFINRPKIEQWFVSHLGPIGEHTPPKQVDLKLRRLLKKHGLPAYDKPGSRQFHQALLEYTSDALAHCAASGHSSYKLPCMCELVHLLQAHSPLPNKNTT